MNGLETLLDAAVSARGGAILRGLVAVLLLTGGIDKLRRPHRAALAAHNFRVAPRPLRTVGLAAGSGEVALGALLLVPATAAVASAAAAGVLLAFATLVAAALARGDRFDCGCLPGAEHVLSGATLARTLGLALAAGLGAAAASGSAPPAFDEVHVSGVFVALVVAGALVTTSAFRRLHDSRTAFAEVVDWEWVVQQHGPSAIEVGR